MHAGLRTSWTWLAAAVLVVACAGCRMPSERACYREALKAAEGSRLPDGARVCSFREARVQVLKNAARVDLTVRVDGQPVPGRFVVWLKRLGRSWKVDRWEWSDRDLPSAGDDA